MTVSREAPQAPNVGSSDSAAVPHLRAVCDLDPAPPVFRELFDAQVDYVWRSLRRLGVREADLEDVTHEVFVGVHRRLGDYEPHRPIRPWLFGFAFRCASDYRRLARNRFEIIDAVAELPDPAPDPLEWTLRAEAIAVAQRALAGLELGRRAVFILHELDDFPIPEVASALGIPVNTAYSRLRLARRELAAAAARLRRGDLA